jgi:nucleotide-binding universal stress UspA family protein
MIETILLATDGSEAVGAAEGFAIAIASRLRARLVALSVVEARVVEGLKGKGLGIAPPSLEGIETFLTARAEAACRRVSDRARSAGVECVAEMPRGVADDRIVERAKSADLVVLGRDGVHADHRSSLIGSTVDAVLRKTNKPAIVVPRGAEFRGGLLLAFDGSPGSRIAARLTVELVGRLQQPVHLFVDSKDKGRAVSRFDEARNLLGTLPVAVREASSTLGRPDVKIIDAAKEASASLIVMGAFGRSRITDYFLGSNSAAVVRTSPIAVLLAR